MSAYHESATGLMLPNRNGHALSESARVDAIGGMPVAKRRRGEGTVYQRKSDGLWCGSVSCGFLNGRRQRQVFYGHTPDEVRRKIAEFQYQRDHAQPVEAIDLSPLLKQSDVAAILNVSVGTVSKMTKRGDIPCVRIGGVVRYRKGDIARLAGVAA